MQITETLLGLPSAEDLVTPKRGKQRDLKARRDAVALIRAQAEARLEILDEQAAQATALALQARIGIARCDGELAMIDAALAAGGEA